LTNIDLLQNKNQSQTVVIHIVPDGDLTSGGVAYASIRLAHEQARSGVFVNIFEIDSSRRVNASWWCNRVNYFDFRANQNFFQKLMFLRKFIYLNNPIIHFHGLWFPKYFPYILLAYFMKSPCIISPHGSLEPGALRQKFLKKYFARKIYFDHIVSRATALWACSEKEQSNLRREFPKVHVDIVSIGVDVPILKTEVLDNSKNQDDRIKIILVISRLNPGKGLVNLINAWGKIQDERWRIIIAGPDENNYRSIVQLEIDKLNLNKFISLIGYINPQERDNLYRQADIFALPSLSENFGIVVAEAMSYGIPVLTTNETPWTKVGLQRGCLCVGVSSSEISKGLKVLMDLSKEEKDCINKSARLFIAQNFTWQVIVTHSKVLLNQLYRT
jgi:glycosyltransferase involved in cell wall biosynthesis